MNTDMMLLVRPVQEIKVVSKEKLNKVTTNYTEINSNISVYNN